MSISQYETTIVVFARSHLKRPKLKKKDLMEWSTAEIKPQNNEEVIFIPELKVFAAFSKAMAMP